MNNHIAVINYLSNCGDVLESIHYTNIGTLRNDISQNIEVGRPFTIQLLTDIDLNLEEFY